MCWLCPCPRLAPCMLSCVLSSSLGRARPFAGVQFFSSQRLIEPARSAVLGVGPGPCPGGFLPPPPAEPTCGLGRARRGCGGWAFVQASDASAGPCSGPAHACWCGGAWLYMCPRWLALRVRAELGWRCARLLARGATRVRDFRARRPESQSAPHAACIIAHSSQCMAAWPGLAPASSGPQRAPYGLCAHSIANCRARCGACCVRHPCCCSPS